MEDCQQKYQKVYSFLKRTLPQERYEGIRQIEPCIIVADGFNKQFMFAILGDEMLYVTENPPKFAKDIRITVDLSSVTSVDLVHDIPDFLGGDQKTQTQHIVIQYKTFSIKPHQKTLSQGLALKSSLLTASALLRLDLDDQSVTAFKPSVVQSYTDRSIRDEIDSARRLYLKSSPISVSEGNIPQVIGGESFQASQNPQGNNLCVPLCGRPLPPPPPGPNPGDCLDYYSLSSMDKKTHRKTRRKHDKDSQLELNSSSSSNELDFLQFQSTSMHDDLREKQRMSSSQELLETSRRRKFWQSGSKSLDGAASSKSIDKEEEIVLDSDHKTTDLHLYILEQGSLMFAFVKSTWNNCILKSTLSFENQKTITASSSRTSTKVDNSQLLTLFSQLKTEILHSHRMEKTFVLINELLTAAQKSFSLKKLFWKSPELFPFIVSQIQCYLPHSPSKSSKRKGNNRADEFDFVVVLLDCLVCMFRGTEILPSRMNVLMASKGKAVKDLLQSILTTPTMPNRSEPSKISPAAQLLLMGTSEGTVDSRKQHETTELFNEITDCATAVLYELVTAVHQAMTFPVEGNSLNICWLVKVMDSIISTAMFVERMMDRQMTIISNSKTHLSPKQAVLLYRQLYILHNIMEYSDYMATTIPRSYSEEFRYYIKQPIVQKKLPVQFPLTLPTLNLLDKVTSCVLKVQSRSTLR